MDFAIKPFKDLYDKYEYKWIDDKLPLQLNIFGIRSSLRKVNSFDDFLYCIFRDDNLNWIIKQWRVTTDPGDDVLLKPINVKGAAILAPGQYKDAYKLDLHRNRYIALCQRLGEVIVYRDNNRNEIHDFDESTKDTGYFGINIHKAGLNSTQVDNWSAGCQVFKKSSEFKEFIDICTLSADTYENKFTYTLFSEDAI